MKYHVIWDQFNGMAVPEGKVRSTIQEYLNNGGGQICIGDIELLAEIRVQVRLGVIPFAEIIMTDIEDRKFYFNKHGAPLNDFWSYHCKVYDDQLFALLS